MARRMLASALHYWCCFPTARRQLQHPCPNVDPSVPPFVNMFFAYIASPPLSGEYMLLFNHEKAHQTG
jgi:hypothetical protein